MVTLPQIEVELRMQRAIFDGYRPHLQVAEGEHLGVVLSGVSAEANETHHASACLVYWPNVDYAALKAGVQFKVKEGVSTVGVGMVTRGWEAVLSNPSFQRSLR